MGPLTTHERVRYYREKFIALRGHYLYTSDPDFVSIAAQLAALMVEVSKVPHSDEQQTLMNDMLDSYTMMLKIIHAQLEPT